MNSSFVVGEAPKVELSNLEEIKKSAQQTPEDALKELEKLDLTIYPKKQTAEVYWTISEFYLKQKKYMRAQILRQKAVDLDPSLEASISSMEIFKIVDKVVKYGIDI